MMKQVRNKSFESYFLLLSGCLAEYFNLIDIFADLYKFCI